MTCTILAHSENHNTCGDMQTYLSLKLDTRRTRKDGTFPIVIRLSFKGVTSYITTTHSCSVLQWNTRLSKVNKQHLSSESINKSLYNQLEQLRQEIAEVDLKNIQNLKQLKEAMEKSNGTKQSLEDFWLVEVERLVRSGKHGNARNYKSALGGVKQKVDLSITFDRVDYNWLIKLETNLLEGGVSVNSVAVYMRTLRALFNKAINSGICDESNYPFRRYSIKTTPTAPRVATIQELQRYFALEVDEDNSLFWDIGRLIFMLRGINFTDLALLTSSCISNNRIVYNRAKTGKLYSIEILPEVDTILKKYQSSDGLTLIPILRSNEYLNKAKLPERLAELRKITNKRLKKFGMLADIQIPLSTYVFRYSHANACRSLGYSKDLISQSLGHGYGMAVTSTYLEDYSIELVDEMNQKVCDALEVGD